MGGRSRGGPCSWHQQVNAGEEGGAGLRSGGVGRRGFQGTRPVPAPPAVFRDPDSRAGAWRSEQPGLGARLEGGKPARSQPLPVLPGRL